MPISAAEFYWDSDGDATGNVIDGTNLGGTGTWDLSTTNWWEEVAPDSFWLNSFANTAVFTGTSETVTLGAPIQAGGLTFNTTGYTLTGNTLTLGSLTGSPPPIINVAAFTHATIESLLAGTSGLTKTGDGTLFLTNNANSYTGDTVINAGALVITNEGQFGASTNTISINGAAQTGTPGYSGGQLIVDGSLGAVTMSRNISISGRGPGAVNASGGLVSVGSNTFNGDINLTGPGSGARISASHGVTTINGTLQLGASADSLFYGNGNFIINGQVTGFDVAGDRFIKSGNLIGTTLWLTNDNNNFLQPLRVDSGTVRVSTPGALGANVGIQQMDSNGGFFEVLTDVQDWSNINFRKRGNGGGITVGHAIGSTLVGRTITFGDVLLDANAQFQVQGRASGSNLVVTGSANGGTAIDWVNGGTGNFSNLGNGLLTINADIQRRSETTARTLTINGNGDTLLTGNLLQAGTGAVSLVKASQSTFTILGTASNATGTTTIQDGTLVIGAMAALPSGTLLIGNATTASGALTYVGVGETSGKAITLNTTTANNYINSSGTGPLVLTGTITALAGAKTLVLGGTSTAVNEIASAIPANATNVQKIGGGTWQLSGANLYAGTTTISSGTLRIQDTFSGTSRNVVADTGAVIFNTDTFTQSAGGTLEYLGDGANASTESLGALTITTGSNTVKATAGSGGTADLTFTSLVAPANGAGVNFVTNTGGSITLTGAADVNGILNAHLFYNGADFASGSTVGAASYTTENTGASLAGANTLPYLVNTADIPSQSTATINAGIKFSDSRSLTLGASQILTIQNGGGTVSGGILVTGGSNVIVSGGTGITSGGAADLVFRTDGAGDILNLNTPITSTTTGGWTKLGAGTLKLGAANANTTGGFVHINEGTVQMQTGSKLGADSIDVNLRQGATLDLNGVSLGTMASGTGSLGTFNGSGTLTNTAAQASIRIGNDNSSSFFTGNITGAIDLVKNGSGTLWLSGPQSYTGVVTISTGNLDVTSLANIGQASGLGLGDATSDAANAASLVFNGGALRYIGQNGANTFQSVQTPSVSIDRLFTLAGNGTIASFGSAGDNDSGTRAANHAALVFNNTADVAFSGAGGRTLTLRGDSLGDNYIGLKLVDNPSAGEALGVTKTDSGLWILGNAANSYSGTTLVQAGALQAEGNALSPNSNLFLDGGGAIFQSSGTFTRALGTGAGEVRFRTDGAREGFAAGTAPLTVTLGTSGLIWGSANSPTVGTTNFLGAGTLYLSSTTALADVNFTNDFEITPGIGATPTVSTTNASTTVTLTSGTTAGLAVGQAISGTNIPAGAYISSINATNQISISVNATATATGVATIISGDGFREIRVDDNTLTGLDFATASGVISGVGGLGKEGTGLLILGDANTYSGKTVIRDGLLTVTSIGAAGDTSSSLGTNVGGGALEIGRPGSTSTANLLYVGAGETATRQIDLVGTTGTRRIDSSGSGALILVNLNNSTAGSVNTSGGAKTLELRGQNTDGNMITSVLGNNAGALTISKADGGVWILAPASGPNTFTGTITAGGGSLGLTTNGIGSASQLNLSNGSIFGYGGDLAINTLVQLNNNTTGVFAGSNNITINANVQKQAGANDQTISNNLENGAVLTVNGNFVNLQTAAATRTISIRGYGDTVWNGIIQDNSGTSLTAWNIAIAPTASFTMTGGTANTYSGATTLTDGILVLDKVGALGTGTFAFNGGTLRVGSSPANLTGANAITNAVQINASPPRVEGTKSIEFSGIVALNGSRTLENALTGGAQLIISNGITNSAAATLTITGSGDTLISGNYNLGTGASGLALNGPGTLSFTGTSAATGTLTANNGTTTLSGASGGSWNAGNVALNGNGILTLDNSAISGGENVAGRLNNSATSSITMNGGVLNVIGDGDGTSELAGDLIVNGIMATITMSGAGPNVLTFDSVNFANSGSSLDLTGIAGIGSTNQLIFSTAPTANIINGVLNRVMISGDFATHTANGVEAFTGYIGGNNLNTAADADTMNLTANAGLGISRTLNALKINGSGLDIGTGSATGATLTLTANSILNTGGNNTLSIPLVSIAGAGLFQVDPGTNLTVSSVLMGAGQINKAGAGGLIFNTRSFQASTFNLSGGLVTLNGGDNSLLFPGAGQLTLDTGATVDLSGNIQYVGVLAGPAGFPGAGGTVENNGSLTTFVTNGGGTFGGVVQDDINLGRIGGGTLTLEAAQTYTGGTALLGGDTTLRDNAALPMTSAPIEINQARLLLRNNDNLQTQIDNRVSDTAPITLRGGTIDVAGRISTAATETMGALTVLEGANTITNATGGGTITSATLTFASLTRSTGATVNFTGSSALGAIGNLPRILFATPLPTVGTGALGAWAIANSTDYAGYNAANGVGVAGTGGFVGYTPDFGANNITNLDAAGRFGAAQNLAAGTTTTGMLRLGGKTINDLTFTGGTDVLNLELGGLLRENTAFSSSVGTSANRGVLTAGGTEVSGTRELVIYANTTGNLSFGGTGTTIGAGATRVTLASVGGLGLAVGMQISNANFPVGTTITAIDNYNVLTLSNPSSNGTSQTNQTFTTGVMNLGSQTSGSNVVTMATTVGLAPGMTITGTGIPTGTFVTSVDSGTQLTLSQAATTTVAGTAAYTLGMTNVIVNSVIADNGFGNSVALVKSGAGVLNLSAANTYSGGTYVDQGTLNLIGGPFTTVVPAGGLTITGGAVVLMNTNEGQIHPTNTVSVNGSGTLTMVGNNTLNSIVFDNNGGTSNPTVNVGGTLTLTSSTSITSTSKNAATTPIVAGGTVVLPTGVNTFSVGAPTLFGDVYTDKRAGLEISSKLTGSGVSLVKSGDGLLEFSSSTSDFTGGISVTAGGIVIGNNSTGTFANTLVSGPLGRGDVTMAAGTVVAVDDGSRTVANAFNWTSTSVNPIFDNTGISTDTMTLNGNLTFGTLVTTGLTANVASPYLNVALGGAITGIGSVTAIGSGSGANTINKTGPGNIIGLNLTGISNTATINLETLTNLNTFALLHDGDGTSDFENVNLGTVNFDTVNGASMDLTIGRAGSGFYFATANNKRIVLGGLVSNTLNNGFRVRNGNNYGLVVPDAITLASGNLFTVDNASTSLQVSGLELSGKISGSNALNIAGNGTLKLTDVANDFMGTINVTNGNVEGSSDAVFGNSANMINLASNSQTEGLTISGTFATNRTINLDAANSGIDVTRGDTFTLNNPFTFTTAANSLAKNYQGTLVLTAAQTIAGGAAADWDGNLIINQGVVSISNAASLGTTTGNVSFGNVGASLELNGGITVLDTLVFASGDDVTTNGVNGSGAVRSVSGANILGGPVSLNTASGTNDRSRAATFTAASGASLEISGVVTAILGNGTGRDAWIGLGGEGTGTLSTAMSLTGSTLGTNRFFSINKFGSGTWNITAADAHPGTRVIIKEGTLSLNGAGTLGTPTAGQETPPTIYLNPTGTLLLNNVSTDVDNRLTGRALNVSGADVTILGNASDTTETVGVFTLREGLSVFTLDADAAGSLNFTTGAITRSAGATLLIRGDNFGTASGSGVATFTGSSYAYVGQVGAAGTPTKGILPWALGDTSISGTGLGFVTSDTAANTGSAILRLLTPAEQTTNFATPLANVNLTTNETLSSVTTFNSLQLGVGGGVALNYVPLTLDSGGLLVQTGNAGLTGFSGVSYFTTTSNRELIVQTVGNLTLDLPIAGTTGVLVKSGPGTLTLGAGNTNHGTVFVNDGTLKLGGGDQTILPGRSLQLNEGGTLDLFGNVQHFNLMESRQTAALAQSDLFSAEAGGNVINTKGLAPSDQATLVLATANVTYTGVIGGNVAVARGQAQNSFQSWNLYSAQTYTGPTLLNGGTTSLLVEGALLNTSSIEISNAVLSLGSSNAVTDAQNITDRIGDTIPITIRGGMLQLRAPAALITTETLGAVTLAGGQNIIDAAEGGTRINQFDITIAGLTRAANSRATVRFLNIDATPNDDTRLFITANPTLTNNIIGGWAVFEREFAGYNPGMGVGGLTTVGFAGYSPNILDEGLATDNIKITLPAAGLTTTLTGNRTVYTLNMAGAASATDDSVLDLGGYTLTLAGGGLILSQATNDRFISVLNGNLTAGAFDVGGDLYIHTANAIATDMVNRDVNLLANIVDNGAGPVTLVLNGDDGRGTGLAGLLGGEETVIRGDNTYSGGTFINAGRVLLNSTNANGTTITALGLGDVTIGGGASTNDGSLYQTFSTNVIALLPNQIANSATVTILGGATLNLNNNDDTLANLAFNNNGGNNPAVTTGTGTLTLTGNITAAGQNPSTNSFSTIAGKLLFSSATANITVDPVQWNGKNLNPILPNLNITASIEGTNIVKAGNGLLRLSGAGAWTGDFDLQAGGLSFGSNNALSSGALTIGNNTYLTSTADNRIIANSYAVSGNFALSDVFNLTMSGPGTLAAGNHDVSVDLALKTLTLSGAVTGSGSINKTGDGILVLGNNSNAYGGATTVSDGILRYGAVDAVPTGSALTVLQGALLDITLGGSAVTVGSLASDSSTAGGVIVTTAASGTTTFTAGSDNTSTNFGGVLVATSGATLNFVKTGTGTLTLGGLNQYNGTTTIADGRLVAKSVGGSSPLGTSQSLIMGGTTTSGVLQLGDGDAPLNLTFTSLAGQGSGTLNKFVGGNAVNSTLTVDVASGATLFFGNIGGAGTNEANLNFVKQGAGDLSFAGTGTSTFSGTTTVAAGKLFMNTPGAFSVTTTSLTVADGAEFTLRGNTGNTVKSYGFSGSGAVVTVGSSTGGTLGFGIDGAVGVNQLVLLAGQTMNVTGTLTTAVYVNGTPTSGNQYVLISGADVNSLHAGSGSFDFNPVVFNGGSFTYALTNDTGGGTYDHWVLTPTAVPSQPDTWWKGDLTGLAQGVWSATLTTGTGFPSNWDDGQNSGIDAVVPPDGQSNVHFSAVGAANFATTLGANMTIKSLTFHTGNAATTIGSSNGVNTLTLGNGVDTPLLTMQTGVGDVGIGAIVALPQDQSWNIEDLANTLTLSGGLTGVSRTLAVNDNGSAAGTLLFSGSAAFLTGTLNQNAGTLAFEDTGSLNTGLDVMLGTNSRAATLKIGGSTAATGAVIGGLSNGTFSGSKVVGGNATTSTLTIGAVSGSRTFSGALGGGGANENNFNLVKAGAGTQILNGTTITYSGTTTVRDGTLQLGAAAVFAPTGALAVIADAGTTAAMDFNGKSFTTTGVLTLGGGAGGIAQILDTNGTPGTLTLGGNIVYDATNDPGGAIIGAKIATGGARTISVGSSVNATDDLTLNGTVAATGSMTIDGAGDGAINGAWTLTGTNLSITFNSTGTWDVNSVTNTTGSGDWIINTGTINATIGNALNAADDIVIDGTGVQGSAVVNISGTAGTSGVHQGDDIFIRNGGQINVAVNNGIGTGTDQINIGDSGSASAAAAGLLNLSANISVGANGILVGNSTNIGNITGTGIITTAGNKDLRNGSIDPGITLAGNGQIFKQNTQTFTFSGDRDAASNGNTNIREGELVLDYTTNNNSKIGALLNLGLAGVATDATLTLNGNASADTTESVAGTVVLPGNMFIALNNGPTRTLALNLLDITRSVPGGTVFFGYSSTDAKATSTSQAGTLGWATVKIGAGTERFASINGSGDIVQAVFTTENNPSLWLPGQDIIVDGATTGLAADCNTITSLTFTSTVNSTVNIASGGRFGITSGGVMVDAGIGAVDMKILGGELTGSVSGVSGEVVVHQNNLLGSLTIGSNIVNSGAITKTGGGTLILTGNNTFLPVGSQLNINEGAVQLGGGNAIGDSMGVFMRTGTTLNIANSSSETVGHLATTAGAVTIALNTSGQLTVNQTAATTYTGVFTGGSSSVFTLNSLGFNFNVMGATTTLFTGSIVVNSGLFQISGSGRIANAAAFTINKGGNLLLDNNTTQHSDRILNTAAITLNSADGTFSGQTQPRGLALRGDQTATNDETVGVVTAASGANYVTMESSAANVDGDIIMTNLVRGNNATLNVRGTNLGSTSAQNNQFRIGNSGNETAFINALVGGAGAAAGKTISIVPWAIGESYAGAVSTTVNMGNSLVTYVSGAGIRPLDLTTEYSTFSGAGGATDNVRESLTANLTGLTTQTVNALVINKNSTAAGTINVSGTNTGGQILTNTSGAFLFTLIPTAGASTSHTIVVDGFDGGIQVGAFNEYVIHVVNPSSAANTAVLNTRIDSALNTAGASLTKSGRGTLELNAVNTYGGGTTINEGVLLVHNNANLGAGGLTLAGGTFKLASDYTDDLGSLTTPTLNVLAGGGSLDTNGLNVVATDLAITGSGPLTKIGAGTLQLAGTGATAYTGLTTLITGTLELNKTAGVNAIGTGGVTVASNAVAATLTNLAANQIADTATVTLINSGTSGAVVWNLNGFDETIGGLSMTTVSNTNTKVLTGAGVLTVKGDITLNHNRAATGNTADMVEISGTGTADTGTLDLGGAVRTITVESTNTGVNLAGSDANIETVIQNGGLIKEGSRTLYLTGTNTYTGSTTIKYGALSLGDGGTTGSLSASSTISNEGLLVFNRSDALMQGLDFAVGITGCGGLTQQGSGTTTLSGVNDYKGATTVNAGTLQFATQTSLYNNNSSNWTAVNLIVGSGATAAFNVGGAGEFTASDIAIIQALGTAAGGFLAGSTIGLDTSSASLGVFSYGTALADTNGGANSIGVTKLGTGTLVLTQANTYTGNTVISGGILQLGSGATIGSLSPSSVISVGGGATFAVNRNDAVVQGTDFSGAAITGLGGFTQAGSGTTALDVANSYTGVTTISAGVLSTSILANGGLPSGIGQASNATSNLVFSGGGVLRYTGVTSVSTDRGFTITDGNTGGIDVSNGATRLTLVGDSAATSGSLQKTGPGALTLNGTYSHTGTTTVSAGTLNGTGALSSQLVVQGGGTFSPGTSVNGDNGNGVGAMNVASVEWQSNSTIVFDFALTNDGTFPGPGAPTDWDYINITTGGGLTLGTNITLSIRSWTDLTTYGPNDFNENSTQVLATPGEGVPAGSDPAAYRWLWVKNAGPAYAGIDQLNQFTIDTSSFFTSGTPNMTTPYAQPLAGGHFWVSAYGNDLYINYSAVPEPGSLLLVGLASLGFAGYRRRKNRSQATTEGSDDKSAGTKLA